MWLIPQEAINIPAGEFRIFGNAPSQSLSLNNNEFSKINMYPNPAKDVISFNEDLKSIKIYDLSGKVIFENNQSYYNGTLLNISNISNGIYIVRIKGMDDKSHYIKLLKIKFIKNMKKITLLICSLFVLQGIFSQGIYESYVIIERKLDLIITMNNAGSSGNTDFHGP